MGPWSHLLKKSLMESFIFCFNFQFFFIIHNENPKNTNSAVIQKRNSISLRHYKFSLKSQ